ncbi:hypothetical protein OPT61_g10691 [Boeremia exigua]|uniref:Uncharacterized protein n=1 Tax=Boeremia exigua TaxID=749465 RepID=A0ACC2HP66_9PLEO|nr:hypothetical protein OPT61_g10691 [Boeremia exigua]
MVAGDGQRGVEDASGRQIRRGQGHGNQCETEAIRLVVDVTQQHAVLLIYGPYAQRRWNARHSAEQLALNKIAKRQLSAIQIARDRVQEVEVSVLAGQVLCNEVLVLHLIPLLLAAAILFVWPSESQAVALTRPRPLFAIETCRQRPVAADFALCMASVGCVGRWGYLRLHVQQLVDAFSGMLVAPYYSRNIDQRRTGYGVKKTKWDLMLMMVCLHVTVTQRAKA